MSGELTEEDIRTDLKRWVALADSISGVARDLGVHDEQLRLFLTGKRPLEPALLAALGLERVVRFRLVNTTLRSPPDDPR
jgi:hypothetical protein